MATLTPATAKSIQSQINAAKAQATQIQAGISKLASGSSKGGAVNASGQIVDSSGRVIGTANPADRYSPGAVQGEVAPQAIPTQPIEPTVDTTQPSPQTATATPFTQPDLRTQAVNQLKGMGYASPDEGEIQGAMDSLKSKYTQGLNLVKNAGVASPMDSGVASAGIQTALPTPQAPEISVVGGIMETDSAFDGLLTLYDQMMSTENQKTSLVDEYTKLSKNLGIEALNAELIDAKRIIEGTEDDIRAEVTATGGFATESQVLALANARNKSLIKNYNVLLETRDNAMTQLNTMMNLTVEDRKSAEAEFDRKLGFAFKVAEFQERATTNARNTYMTLGEQMGWDTMLSSVSAYERGVIGKTLGLNEGGLSSLAERSRQNRALKLQEQGLDMDIKRQQLYNLALTGRKLSADLTEVSGADSILNLSQAEGSIQQIQQLTQSPAIDSVVGTSLFGRAAGGFKGVIGRFLTGAVGGGAVGAVAGAPLGGVGAIPGAVIGGLVGGIGLASQGAKDKFSGERQNLIAGVEQLRSQLNLDTLIQAKSKGATFGALSNQELQVLANAATKLGTWAMVDSNGKILGYNTTETNFRKELDKINNYAKLDYILKGGSPESVGAQVIDGKIFVQNSDGSVTQIP